MGEKGNFIVLDVVFLGIANVDEFLISKRSSLDVLVTDGDDSPLIAACFSRTFPGIVCEDDMFLVAFRAVGRGRFFPIFAASVEIPSTVSGALVGEQFTGERARFLCQNDKIKLNNSKKHDKANTGGNKHPIKGENEKNHNG